MEKTFYKRIADAQAELKAPKGQFNSFGNYKYRSCEDILEAAKPILAKHGLFLVLSDDVQEIGGRWYVKATATLWDIETGACLCNTALAREEETKKGMDASQITGTASSYARKYALNGLFCIDDTKDADTNEYTQTTAETVETVEDAKQFVLTFGKHKGETLWEVWGSDFDYIRFLNNGEKTDAIIKQAIQLINQSLKQNKN